MITYQEEARLKALRKRARPLGLAIRKTVNDGCFALIGSDGKRVIPGVYGLADIERDIAKAEAAKR